MTESVDPDEMRERYISSKIQQGHILCPICGDGIKPVNTILFPNKNSKDPVKEVKNIFDSSIQRFCNLLGEDPDQIRKPILDAWLENGIYFFDCSNRAGAGALGIVCPINPEDVYYRTEEPGQHCSVCGSGEDKIIFNTYSVQGLVEEQDEIHNYLTQGEKLESGFLKILADTKFAVKFSYNAFLIAKGNASKSVQDENRQFEKKFLRGLDGWVNKHKKLNPSHLEILLCSHCGSGYLRWGFKKIKPEQVLQRQITEDYLEEVRKTFENEMSDQKARALISVRFKLAMQYNEFEDVEEGEVISELQITFKDQEKFDQFSEILSNKLEIEIDEDDDIDPFVIQFFDADQYIYFLNLFLE